MPISDSEDGDGSQDPVTEGEPTVDKAFDLWLTRGLHQLYDAAVQEAVPEEWLRLIEQDRTARPPAKE